jgi:ElaB/YqjD/DUF883 family membrane-anchored ribosome-binding protein
MANPQERGKNNFNGGSESTATGVVGAVKDAAQGVADTASNIGNKVSSYADDAYKGAKDAGQKVQEWTGDAYDAAAERVGDFGNEVASLVRKHPVPSILIGFGVGFLLGRAAKMI